MKKSILALGAAALFGGLGFAGSAQAIAFFGDAGNDNHATALPQATDLKLNAGGLGHVLFVPYYSAQGSMSTMFNITNTDILNGKVVKVRFRGAANSDDVMDFTVMLSPGDVWTASVKNEGGVATLHTDDNSCTLPQSVNAPFNTLRLDTKNLSPDALNLHVNEGYIEILNMADIPPMLWDDSGATPAISKLVNPLFTTTKHVNSVPPCDQTTLNSTNGILSAPMMADDYATANGLVSARQAAFDAGLGAPTGQLMASYAVLTLDKVATYGGSATAIRAVTTSATGVDSNARGNIIYSPQLGDDLGANGTFGDVANINSYTGDPLLRNTVATATAGIINPLWYDLPDMSTPLVTDVGATNGRFADVAAPLTQVDGWLAAALAKGNVINDWVYDAGKGWDTDWVISQPTRRYYAAVDYSTGKIVWNSDMSGATTSTQVIAPPATDTLNRYRVLTTGKMTSNSGLDMGTYACMMLSWNGYDREENGTVVSGSTTLSPGAVVLKSNCGEVYTVTFGRNTGSAVLQAQVSNAQYVDTSKIGANGAGWGMITLGGSNLPAVGFAATSVPYYGGNIGYTIPHRWAD